MTWRVQLAGWRVVYEPRAIVWILMPETLRGLWKQRLRWAQGGSQMMLDFFRPVMGGPAHAAADVLQLRAEPDLGMRDDRVDRGLGWPPAWSRTRCCQVSRLVPAAGGWRSPSRTSCRRWSVTCWTAATNRA